MSTQDILHKQIAACQIMGRRSSNEGSRFVVAMGERCHISILDSASSGFATLHWYHHQTIYHQQPFGTKWTGDEFWSVPRVVGQHELKIRTCQLAVHRASWFFFWNLLNRFLNNTCLGSQYWWQWWLIGQQLKDARSFFSVAGGNDDSISAHMWATN